MSACLWCGKELSRKIYIDFSDMRRTNIRSYDKNELMEVYDEIIDEFMKNYRDCDSLEAEKLIIKCRTNEGLKQFGNRKYCNMNCSAHAKEVNARIRRQEIEPQRL